MKGKKQDPKKAAAAGAEEDLSDLSSLPHIKMFTMTTLYHFYIKKHKDDVRQAVNSLLSEEGLAAKEEFKHVKTITRQAILETAQGTIIFVFMTN